MTEDFAVLDFAVLRADAADVARALAQAWPAVTAPPAPVQSGDRPSGLLGRLMKRREGEAAADAASNLTIHTAGLMPDPPFARTDASAPALKDSALRLSTPRDSAEPLTLIELMEDLDGEARLCRALSRNLRGVEVFYFRYSGALHPGAHFAVHVYKDGRALRRAESYCPSGTHAEAGWTATDAGMPHPAEADSLPAPEAPAAEIMTPERQGSILSALGIEADSLFSGMDARDNVIILSPLPGGAPISELETQGSAADLVPPPAFAVEPEAAPEPEPETVPAPIETPQDPDPTPPEETTPPAPEVPAERPTPVAMPEDAAPPAPMAEAEFDQNLPPLSPFAPDAPLPDGPDAWEQEVTRLLLACVEAALPDPQRIPWLEGFTAELEAGRIQTALDTAENLIASAARPPEDLSAAIGRLRALYAHLRPKGEPGH